jgi:hypothetical protein
MVGIAASVCLFIGATTRLNVSMTDQLQKQALSEYHNCQEKTPEARSACSVKFAKDFRATTQFHWQAALYALIFIPIVWLIVYGLVALARWIKARSRELITAWRDVGLVGLARWIKAKLIRAWRDVGARRRR